MAATAFAAAGLASVTANADVLYDNISAASSGVESPFFTGDFTIHSLPARRRLPSVA
jgi:hypothetical protein